MKAIHILVISFMIFGCFYTAKAEETTNYELEEIYQDFDQALQLAKKSNKLVFIDFYTPWCSPCKILDKVVFQNDSIRQILGKDYILLKYNAENDTVFHLSKKHHVRSYPTAIVLNSGGYVVNRKYGFPGEDFQSLSKNVLDFTQQTLEINKRNEYLKGYASSVRMSEYPQFYIDFVNRTNVRPKAEDILDFFESKENFLMEEDFSTLFYFAEDSPSNVGDILLEDRQNYIELYGELDLNMILYYIVSGKFGEAITENNKEKYGQAIAFAIKALGQDYADDILPGFEIKRLKAQNKWKQVFEIYEITKDKGEMEGGTINHICWDIYKNCDDKEVNAKCIDWMKELTSNNPEFNYLDTYAFLLYKSENKEETKKVAKRAIEVGKQQGSNTKELEEMMEKL